MIALKNAAAVKPRKKIFEVKLTNDSRLFDVKMSKNIVDKIGADDTIVLPCNAYVLHAKYYLALSYPLLSMGQFMGISSIPDAIERRLKKALK